MTFLPLGYPDRSKQSRVYPGKIMQMYILLRYVIPVMFLFFNFFQKKEMQSLQSKKQKDRISLLRIDIAENTHAAIRFFLPQQSEFLFQQSFDPGERSPVFDFKDKL